VLDARVRELAVVNQPVDSAKVDECAEVGQSNDDALAYLPDFEGIEKFLFLGLQLFFENEALRKDDPMALVIEVDDLQAKMLSDELVEIPDGLAPNLRGGHESPHAEIDEHAAFDDLRYCRFDHLVVLVRFDDLLPGLERPGSPFRQKERPVQLVDSVNHYLDGVADAQKFWIDGERELAERKDAFGLAADVDQHLVLVLLNDRAGKHLAFIENLERFFVEALLERQLVLLVVSRSDFSCRDLRFPLS
jgi:hypothetical protein